MGEGGRSISRRSLLRGTGVGAASVLVTGAGVAAAAGRTGEERSRERASTNSRLVDGGGRAGIQRVVWSVDTGVPAVSLTFDDGPDPELTPLVLDALAHANAKATFLALGERAARHPDLVRAVLAGGHEVGSHSMNHRDLSNTGEHGAAEVLAEAAGVLRDISGEAVRWFRPPWGRMTGSALRVAAELDQDVLLWSTSATGLGPTAAKIGASLPARLTPGRVVLLHDGVARGRARLLSRRRSTADLMERRRVEIAALPEALARAADLGVQFVTASELVALERSPS